MQYERILKPIEHSFFLFGARGTGKSTWLKKHYSDALYIDLLDESRYQRYLADPSQFASEVRTVAEGSWVIVDEVQRLPSLLNEVHRAIEEKKIRFALSGSSARKLKRAGTNLLAGRVIRRTIHPFLPYELEDDFDLDQALQVGTIPVVWQSPDRESTLESYTQMYLREEIQAEALVRNLPSFARFLPVAAVMHAQILSISSIARDSESHRNTVASYIDILEDTLLAFRLPAFEAKLRVKERKHPKFYFIDCGLVRALKRQRGSLAIEEKGALFEGWVANLIRSYNEYQRIYDEWYYWSPIDSKETEVDFLLRQGSEFIAIEVKSSNSISRRDLKGLKAIEKLKNLKRRIVVYRGSTRQRIEPDIEILPVKDFIKELPKMF